MKKLCSVLLISMLLSYVSLASLTGQSANQDIGILREAPCPFPSTSENHYPDPLVMNTAGPGKSNMDNFIPQIAGGVGQYILHTRDIVLIELRGLRHSKPYLACDDAARRSMMSKNLSTDETMAVLGQALSASLNN